MTNITPARTPEVAEEWKDHVRWSRTAKGGVHDHRPVRHTTILAVAARLDALESALRHQDTLLSDAIATLEDGGDVTLAWELTTGRARVAALVGKIDAGESKT